MPEVPELLTLKNNLMKRFAGKKVADFQIHWEKQLKTPKQKIIDAVGRGRMISIDRIGKTLELNFDNKNRLGIHLMQSGKPYLIPTDKEIKWKIIEIIFEDGLGFGIHDFSGQTRLQLNPESVNVPDVLTPDLNFDYLKSLIQKSSKAQIKTLLTNQKKIRGLGNAYVDEILWEVKISPASIAYKIPDDKLQELILSIEKVLLNAEVEITKVTGKDELMIEKRDFMNVHNAKRKTDPNGDQIHKGEIANAKTYWTDSQVLYEFTGPGR
jgi:formamidopyrimidine-DNA glycosylase